MRRLVVSVSLLAASAALAQVGPAWERVPGPYGGEVVALAASPDGAAALASTSDGLYRTTDGGGSWAPTGRASTYGLYAAPDGAFWSWWPGPLERSLDGGVTWTPAATGLGGFVTALAAGPDGTLVAATSEGVFTRAPEATAWTPTGFVGDAASVAVGLDGTLYAGIGGEVYDVPIARSTDGGTTWTIRSLRADDFAVVEHLVVLADGSVVAGGAHRWNDYSPRCGLFRTTSGGASWQPLEAYGERCVERLWAVGGDLYAVWDVLSAESNQRSADGGATWTVMPEILTGAAPGPGGTVMVGTERNGVRIGERTAPDGGPFADASDGLAGADVRRVVPLPSGVVFALHGVEGVLGLFRSDDGGQTWARALEDLLPDGAGFGGIGVLTRTPGGALLLGPPRGRTVQGGLFRSTDDGATWQDVSMRDNAGVPLRIHSVAQTPEGHLWATFGYYGPQYLFRSTDDGATWVRLPDPGTQGFASLSFAPDGTAWALEPRGQQQRVIRSDDDGQTWTVAFEPQPAPAYARLRALDSGALLLSTSTDEYRSADGGATWAPIDIGLGATWRVAGFADVPGETVYAVQSDGPPMFRSDDDGQTWAPAADGLPAGAVGATFDASTGRLWVPVPGVGVFRTAAPVVAGEGAPASRALRVTVGPVPSGRAATLRLHQPSAAPDVLLDVYDALGRRVMQRRLVAGAGESVHALDGHGLVPGAYVVRVTSGADVAVARWVIGR